MQIAGVIVRIKITFILGFSCLLLLSGILKANEMDKRLNDFYRKEKVTILVTDSGLGGLSVAAHIEANFKKWHPFRKVKIIFVNALASETHFYNKMKTTNEKVSVFNNALQGMTQKLSPDLILTACNTLSVLYNKTEYSQHARIPVIGIVGFGVDMIYKKMSQSDKNSVIILGTPTTIGQDSHKNGLIKKGIPKNRIITQACPMLESEIQMNPASDMVQAMIEMFAEEALGKFKTKDTEELLLGLCCTHYQYAADTFQKVFSDVSGKTVHVLDPNEKMSAYIFENSNKHRFSATRTETQVVSQAKLSPEDIKSISGMIRPVSPAFSKALQKYIRLRHLFPY